ncbi:hypothetical protein D3C86_1941900 [compost metagenome]
MYGLERYFLVKPQWKNGRFFLPEIEGLPVRIDWEYCKKENKIIREQLWEQQDVPKYAPVVSM